jgi:tetratricopeptide (TPR) repeat protein
LEDDRAARLNRGLARYQTGAYEDALADFDAVLAALGDGAGAGTASEADSAGAPAGGTQAAQLEGASRIDVRYYRANTYFQLERYRRAVEDYRAVIQAQPENADAMYNLGMAYIRLAEGMEEEDNQ